MPDTEDRARWLSLATWHVREALCRGAMGDDSLADVHLDSAREYLHLAGHRLPRTSTADDITATIETARDAA